VLRQIFPTGVALRYVYTDKGFLKEVRADSNVPITPLPAMPGGTAAAPSSIGVGNVLWNAVQVNAMGRIEASNLANGSQTLADFEPQTGRLLSLKASKAGTTVMCDASSLVRWRQCIGEEGCEWLVEQCIAAALKSGVAKRASLETVELDTTVQPKAIGSPHRQPQAHWRV
jgi:hypothetical protein